MQAGEQACAYPGGRARKRVSEHVPIKEAEHASERASVCLCMRPSTQAREQACGYAVGCARKRGSARMPIHEAEHASE